MFLSKIINQVRSPSNVHNLTNLFQRCLISSTPAFNNKLTTPQTLELVKAHENKDPIKRINEQLQSDDAGRLFAVIQVVGKQFKVTAGDVILLEGYWEPSSGDRLRLEKVLMCGGQDFTLIGRPLLQEGLVDVQATIIEKSLSHTRTHFKFKKRKQYRRMNFQRSQTTMVRINSIEITEPLERRSIKIPGIESVFH